MSRRAILNLNVRPIAAALLMAVMASGCWAQYGGDAAHTGTQPFETKLDIDTVKNLTTAWTAPTEGYVQSTPAVALGSAFVVDTSGTLSVFDASGGQGCSGTPKTCVPRWTAAASAAYSSPAVVDGFVYVGSAASKLYAFDAAGQANCAGVPKTCAPRWTGTLGGAVYNSSPAVSDGRVFVGADDGRLYAFDAAGVQGCSGSPKVCAPLWTGATGGLIASSPAVANGRVYVGSADHKLYAFDAAGVQGCSGVPKTCQPLWTTLTGGPVYTSPSVADGRVFVGSDDAKLYALDASGVQGCSGSPKICAPLWTATAGGGVGDPSIAYGNVYVNSWDGKLYAFDAAGNAGCSGAPKTCSPRWTATVGTGFARPAIANGVVYDGATFGSLLAFDAAGVRSCSGVPKTCAPVASVEASIGLGASVAVVGGTVYVGGNVPSQLTALTLPVTTLHAGFLDFGARLGSPAASDPGGPGRLYVEDPDATVVPAGDVVNVSCWVHGYPIYGGSDYWYRVADGPNEGDYIYYYFIAESGPGPGPNDFEVPTAVPSC